MQCTNKLKQLSLAMHNYHNTHNSLPAGGAPFYITAASSSSLGLVGSSRVSVFFSLLPFYEQQALYETWTSSAQTLQKAGTQVYPWITNASYPDLEKVIKTNLDALRCPSEPMKPLSGDSGHTNYAYSTADFAAWVGDENQRAVFAHRQWHGMEFMKDGTSNTAVFSERAYGQAGNKNVVGGMAYVAGAKLQDDTTKPPTSAANCSIAACLAAQSGRVYASSVTDTDISGAGIPTFRWLDGIPAANGFSTILPPNSITCVSSGKNSTARAIASASSYHTGGVQVGFGDGSVRFITETITAKTSGGVDFCVTNGVSPFDVWGAIGSPNGSESVALP
jgi:prepilin-type processing-associated H-X9-DG protein